MGSNPVAPTKLKTADYQAIKADNWRFFRWLYIRFTIRFRDFFGQKRAILVQICELFVSYL